ncbi:hypothetical protein Ct61P_09014 [Colletotrichum tofieldiae]|nr:hypothetical protein Ct61P_09014 [Colletotrichum tofieldiae]
MSVFRVGHQRYAGGEKNGDGLLRANGRGRRPKHLPPRHGASLERVPEEETRRNGLFFDCDERSAFLGLLLSENLVVPWPRGHNVVFVGLFSYRGQSAGYVRGILIVI